MSQMAEGLFPVLQVADSPQLAAGPASQRCLLLLSDGMHSQRGALATSLTHLVRDGHLRRGTVVRVLDYVCTVVQSRREAYFVTSGGTFRLLQKKEEKKTASPGDSLLLNYLRC